VPNHSYERNDSTALTASSALREPYSERVLAMSIGPNRQLAAGGGAVSPGGHAQGWHPSLTAVSVYCILGREEINA
jgi:hypothetical protein